MVYRLVSAAALGFDLTRVPGGCETAEVLLRALTADASTSQALAAGHPGTCRRDCWDDVRQRVHRRPGQAVRGGQRDDRPDGGSHALDVDLVLDPAVERDGEQPRPAAPEVLTRLAGAPLGTIDALDRFLRHDVLDWTWESAQDLSVQRLRDRLAADVLVDATAAAYCGPLLDDGQREHLIQPYRTTVAGLPTPRLPEVADGRPIRALDQVSRWTATDRRAFRAAVVTLQGQAPQRSAAMHDAGWAAHLSGRTRTAAGLQLQAVTAFARAGLTATDATEGCWDALSGVVQGLVVADLLGDDELGALLAPWRLLGF